MHRSSKIPKSIRPPRNGLPYAGFPDNHPYKAGYGQPGYIEDSRIAVVLATMAKMVCKWPIWLQIKMTRATMSGLPQGLSYGCALGTIVGVDAGYSHTVADMTCTQVTLVFCMFASPEARNYPLLTQLGWMHMPKKVLYLARSACKTAVTYTEALQVPLSSALFWSSVRSVYVWAVVYTSSAIQCLSAQRHRYKHQA